MKGQMFLITMIFMTGLVFMVQQLLIQYSALDLSAPFRENEIYLLRNTRDIINTTIKSTPDCEVFSDKMESLANFLNSRDPKGGYIISVDYRLNCAYWGNTPPAQAPLNVSVKIVTTMKSESSENYFMYSA